MSKSLTTAAAPSLAQQEYLASQLRQKNMIRTWRIMLLVLILSLWELSARLGFIDRFIFSSPTLIVKCLISMIQDKSIFVHTGVTLAETLVSFAVCTAAGLACALFLWASPTAAGILEPFLVLLNSLPKSALAPLLIVWLGNNMTPIVTAAVSVAVFGSILTLYSSFCQTDDDKIRLIRSLGGTRSDVLFKVLLPGSLPLLINNMKVNIGLCLVGVIIGEFLSARAGLGYLITYSAQTFTMTVLMTSIMVLCLLSWLLYQAIACAEKKISR